MSNDTGHDLFSPSSSGRAMACPASVTRHAAVPESPDADHSAADWGTDSHGLLEAAVNFGIDATFTVDPKDPEGQEKADCAQVAVEYVTRRREEERPCAVNMEMRVDPGKAYGLVNTRGSADIVIASSTVLEVADFKTGRWVVEPDAAQLRMYLQGVLNEYWPDRSIPPPFQRFLTTVIQPRAPHTNGVIRSREWTLAEMQEFEQRLVAAHTAAFAPNPPANPGDEQCKWCRAKPTCAEYSHWVGKAIGSDMPVLNDTVSSASDEDLARMKSSIPTIEARIDQIEKEVKRRLEAGHTLPGWKLAQPDGRPAWKEKEPELKKVFRKLKLKLGQYTTPKMKTPLQVMKEKDLTEEQSAAIAELWHRPPGAWRVVADTNPASVDATWMQSIQR